MILAILIKSPGLTLADFRRVVVWMISFLSLISNSFGVFFKLLGTVPSHQYDPRYLHLECVSSSWETLYMCVCVCVCVRVIMCVYVLTSLLYDAKFWVIYRRHIHLLEPFYQCYFRTTLNINWSVTVKDTSIETILLQIKMRQVVYFDRIEKKRLTKILPPRDHHASAALRKGYKDILK